MSSIPFVTRGRRSRGDRRVLDRGLVPGHDHPQHARRAAQSGRSAAVRMKAETVRLGPRVSHERRSAARQRAGRAPRRWRRSMRRPCVERSWSRGREPRAPQRRPRRRSAAAFAAGSIAATARNRTTSTAESAKVDRRPCAGCASVEPPRRASAAEGARRRRFAAGTRSCSRGTRCMAALRARSHRDALIALLERERPRYDARCCLRAPRRCVRRSGSDASTIRRQRFVACSPRHGRRHLWQAELPERLSRTYPASSRSALRSRHCRPRWYDPAPVHGTGTTGSRRRYGVRRGVVRRDGRHDRRGRLQHLAHRLSGDRHRSLLSLSDRGDDLSAHRQLRRGERRRAERGAAGGGLRRARRGRRAVERALARCPSAITSRARTSPPSPASTRAR